MLAGLVLLCCVLAVVSSTEAACTEEWGGEAAFDACDRFVPLEDGLFAGRTCTCESATLAAGEDGELLNADALSALVQSAKLENMQVRGVLCEDLCEQCRVASAA